MPRIQLTDSEAALIEKLRAKNAGVRGFNEGIEHAIALLDTRLKEYTDDSSWHPNRVRQIAAELASAKKPEILS